MINNLIHTQELKIEMYKQLRRTEPQISEAALINRMEIKDEQMLQKLKKLAALLCASCEEIGTPSSIDLTVELGAARDE